MTKISVLIGIQFVHVLLLVPWTVSDLSISTPKQTGAEEDFVYTLLSAYGYSATGRSSLIFDVQACQDAYVGLFAVDDENGNGQTYMVMLGGYNNQQSRIMKGKYGPERGFHTGVVLDCNAFKTFKVEWFLGKTTVYSFQDDGSWQEMMEWQDTASTPVTVNFIGVSTGIWADGQWRIRTDDSTTTEAETTTSLAETSTTASTSTSSIPTTTTTTTSQHTTETTNTMTTTETTTNSMTTTTTGTTNVMTTSITESSVGSTETTTSTSCRCLCIERPETTSACNSTDVLCKVDEIKKELIVGKGTLSSSIRKKISATDDRPTAQAMGFASVFILVVVAALIVIPDIIGLLRFLNSNMLIKNDQKLL